MNIIVKGVPTSYAKEGRGPVVLLVHGWGDSKESFDFLENTFAKKYTIIALDLPGFGSTGVPKEAYDLTKYAYFMKEFLEKLGVSELYGIVGHSNGGAIALKALSLDILNPSKLVLLASAGVRRKKSLSKKLLQIVVKVGKYPLLIAPEPIRKRLRAQLYKSIGSDFLVAEHMQESFKLLVNEDILGQIAEIETDTLLIYGSEDRSTPARDGEAINSALKNSEIVIIPGAGHFVHQENHKQVAQAIGVFLDAR